MQGGSFGRSPWRTGTVRLIMVCIAVFVLQEINAVYVHLPLFNYLALSPRGLLHGHVYQLLTFQFLHANGLHLLLNLLALYMFGLAVEDRIGRWRLVEAYLLSGLVGGLFQVLMGVLLPQYFGLQVLGASAGVFGIIALFSLLEPNQHIYLWFVLPVRAKYFLVAATGIALFYVLVPSQDSSVAHAAHLGGIAAGYAYLRWILPLGHGLLEWRPRQVIQEVRELVKAGSSKHHSWRKTDYSTEETMPTEEFISREVDPILDKISAHGIHSLTPKERRILEAARRKMTR